MTDDKPKTDWAVVFAVVTSAASLVFSAGIVWANDQKQDADIAALKASDRSAYDRLARIETKLDIILADRKGGATSEAD